MRDSIHGVNIHDPETLDVAAEASEKAQIEVKRQWNREWHRHQLATHREAYIPALRECVRPPRANNPGQSAGRARERAQRAFGEVLLQPVVTKPPSTNTATRVTFGTCTRERMALPEKQPYFCLLCKCTLASNSNWHRYRRTDRHLEHLNALKKSGMYSSLPGMEYPRP